MQESHTGQYPEKAIQKFAWWDSVLALGLGIIAFLVYAVQLAPTVTGEDSGELITAAYFLGIAHPPGYPLWCLLAHPFTWLPWGDVAWRVNLSSAFFAGATISVMYFLGMHLFRSRFSSVVAAFCLAFSYEFFEQSVIAEVYTLNAFLVAVLWIFLVRWYQLGRPNNLLYLFAAIYGLSMGNHSTMIMLGQVFGLFVLIADGVNFKRWGIYLRLTVLALVMAVLVNAYIPLRSLANPPMDWGNPETLHGWWAHVMRHQYAFMMEQYPRSLMQTGRQLVMMGRLMLDQGTLVFVLLAFVGLVLAFMKREERLVWGMLVVCGVWTTLSAVFAQNPLVNTVWYQVMSVFAIPFYMVMALGVGKAVEGRKGFVTGVIAVPLLVVMLGMSSNRIEANQYYQAATPARWVMARLAPDAIVFPKADHRVFPMLYLQEVKGERGDVLLGRKYGFLNVTELEAVVPGLVEQYTDKPLGRFENEIITRVAMGTERPVYIEREMSFPTSMGLRTVRLLPGLIRVLRKGEVLSDKEEEERAKVKEMLFEMDFVYEDTEDFTLNYMYLEGHLFEAALAYEYGDRALAQSKLEKSIGFLNEDASALVRAGTIAARAKDYETARKYWEEAVAKEPLLEAPRRNLEKLKVMMGE